MKQFSPEFTTICVEIYEQLISNEFSFTILAILLRLYAINGNIVHFMDFNE